MNVVEEHIVESQELCWLKKIDIVLNNTNNFSLPNYGTILIRNKKYFCYKNFKQ